MKILRLWLTKKRAKFSLIIYINLPVITSLKTITITKKCIIHVAQKLSNNFSKEIMLLYLCTAKQHLEKHILC
jgi:hypothetical protein